MGREFPLLLGTVVLKILVFLQEMVKTQHELIVGRTGHHGKAQRACPFGQSMKDSPPDRILKGDRQGQLGAGELMGQTLEAVGRNPVA